MSYDFQEHWNLAYKKIPTENLGWYEKNPEQSLYLIDKCELELHSRIFNAGAGSSTLIEALHSRGYSNLIVNDIAATPLSELKQNLNRDIHGSIEFIVDDLTAPQTLQNIAPVDLWVDRAVLHFFTEQQQQQNYFNLIRALVKEGGFVLLAEFSKEGAKKCSGLDVVNYNTEMFEERLGEEFELIEAFNYSYTQPSGNSRPFIYSLFQRRFN